VVFTTAFAMAFIFEQKCERALVGIGAQGLAGARRAGSQGSGRSLLKHVLRHERNVLPMWCYLELFHVYRGSDEEQDSARVAKPACEKENKTEVSLTAVCARVACVGRREIRRRLGLELGVAQTDSRLHAGPVSRAHTNACLRRG